MPRSRQALLAGAVVVAAAVLLSAPSFLDGYWMKVVTFALMFAALSSALNITAGFAGYPAFGDVVWFGLGAYVTGVLMTKEAVPFAAAVPVAVAFCTIFAGLIGPAFMRLRGHYFAIGTLGLNEATRAVVSNIDVTNAGYGISLPLTSGSVESSSRFFYYLFFAAMATAVTITFVVSRTRAGYALRAIRVSEEAATSLGVNATFMKSLAWTLSAGLIGLCGSIYSYFINYIDPPSAFDIGVSIKMFVIMLLGGVGTIFGPVIGAFGIQLLENEVWGRVYTYHLMILGGIVIALVLFLPRGVVGFIRSRVRDAAALARPGPS